jgi:YhcH/YjgK/YiaL family protein
MILDSINNSTRYVALHPGFKTSFDFLKNHSLDQLIDGKHTIDGDRLFALGMATEGKGQENAVFETHRKYIDIQFTVSSCDTIGWDEQANCTPDPQGYDTDKDVEFYTDRPMLWIPVSSGRFAIFYPEDAHAPFGTDTFVHKIVIKIAVEWR